MREIREDNLQDIKVETFGGDHCLYCNDKRRVWRASEPHAYPARPFPEPDKTNPKAVTQPPSLPCLSSLAPSQELLSLAVYGARHIPSSRTIVPDRILDLLWFF